jgi:hypothetical protein
VRRNSDRLLYSGILLLVSNLAAASFSENFIDPEDGMFDASKYLSEQRFGFLPVPMIITEPAVGVGLGMMAIFFHESEEQKKQRITSAQESGKAILPENISIAMGALTDNGTWAAGLGHLGFWKDDSVRYKGFLGYPSVNMDFYSIGGVELPAPIELNVEGPAVYNQLLFRLGESDWFVGAHQAYSSINTGLARRRDQDQLPILELIPGLEGFIDEHFNRHVTGSGVGLLAEFDSRNNQFNPEQGYKYGIRFMWFDGAIGSDNDYVNYSAKGLNYWTLAEKFVLGFRMQYDGVSSTGDGRLPVYVPPAIQLRGIPAGRYQGNNVAVSEVQLDYKFNFRWKVSAFLGAGRAAQEFSDLGDAATRVSKGLGFRYLVAKRYGFAMGIDVAKGPEDTAFYIQAGSNW